MTQHLEREFFQIIKGSVEASLEKRDWLWSVNDSYLLDWSVEQLDADLWRFR